MAAQLKSAVPGGKGQDMEERLRAYFLSLGYYVLRGVKFTYNRFDVTDVDLWLYLRPTPISRERCNVDIKNKKTPQALERIFWAKGIQRVLGLERCIVATTDPRSDVAAFGHAHEVTVLDGTFLSRLEKSARSATTRLTEEQLMELVDRACLGKIGGDWKGGYERSKARVLSGLDFDGANQWLHEIATLLDVHLSGPVEGDAALRLAYANVGMFLVAVDFLMQGCLSMDTDQRRYYLTEGFRYGKNGKASAEGIVRVASRLVSAATGEAASMDIVERELRQQFSGVRAEVLGEFFAKAGAQGTIIEVAREFEAAAYALQAPFPAELSVPAQAVMGTLSDHFGRDRKRVLASRPQMFAPASPANAAGAAGA
ncbi:hypothetical protein [Cupriavidus oxalaticus]|uniref:hypothetical protein n=1 Tax=Cupriavidus oxalaticus TaxID=96344 RepID=UPI00316BE1ED